MNDLIPHKHGDEGEGSTHFACPEMMEKLGDKVGCCGCNRHSCKPMKQKKKTVDEITWMKFKCPTCPLPHNLSSKELERIKQVVMEAIGEDENGVISSESRIGNAWQIARNALRAEIRANIEKLFSEEV